MPHAQPRDHVIKDGDGVVIDMGVNLDGYMSDLTRTIVVGKPDDKFKKIYDIVLAAQLTAEELVRTGMTGGEAHMHRPPASSKRPATATTSATASATASACRSTSRRASAAPPTTCWRTAW